MAKTQTQETARVEFRMPPKLKQEVEEAAALVGLTFTSFATEALIARSRQVKRDHTLTKMGDQERDAFLMLISNPPEPSEALAKLMQAKVTL